MADGFKLFGFEIKRNAADKAASEPLKAASVVPPTDDDGAGYVTSPSNHYGMHMDIYADLQAKDQNAVVLVPAGYHVRWCAQKPQGLL